MSRSGLKVWGSNTRSLFKTVPQFATWYRLRLRWWLWGGFDCFSLGWVWIWTCPSSRGFYLERTLARDRGNRLECLWSHNTACLGSRAPPGCWREKILARQSPIWGDDELLAGLLRISKRTGADQCVHVWDPLLISSSVVDSQTRTWVDLLGRLGSVAATVISAFAVDNHWYPLVWGLDSETTKLFTCGVLEAQYAAFQFLNSIVGVHRSGAQQPWKSTPLGFCPTGHCGALALLFVRHLLWGEPLVYMQAQVEAAAESSSVDFGTELSSVCHRPRLAALGLDPSRLLGDLLQRTWGRGWWG